MCEYSILFCPHFNLLGFILQDVLSNYMVFFALFKAIKNYKLTTQMRLYWLTDIILIYKYVFKIKKVKAQLKVLQVLKINPQFTNYVSL